MDIFKQVIESEQKRESRIKKEQQFIDWLVGETDDFPYFQNPYVIKVKPKV